MARRSIYDEDFDYEEEDDENYNRRYKKEKKQESNKNSVNRKNMSQTSIGHSDLK